MRKSSPLSKRGHSPERNSFIGRHFFFPLFFPLCFRTLRPLKRCSPPNSKMTKSWRTRQLLPINQLYLAVTGTFFQNLVILVRVYRFRERVLFALPLAALCRAAISIRMRECAPRPCHTIGRKVALCRPMKKKIFLLLLFSPLFIERGDDSSSKRRMDFSWEIFLRWGRKVLQGGIMIMRGLTKKMNEF